MVKQLVIRKKKKVKRFLSKYDSKFTRMHILKQMTIKIYVVAVIKKKKKG